MSVRDRQLIGKTGLLRYGFRGAPTAVRM